MKFSKIFLFFFFCKYFFCEKENVEKNTRLLSERITEIKVGRNIKHLIQIQVGNPPQAMLVKISTAICGLWLFDGSIFRTGFNIERSKTFHPSSEKEHIDNVIGYVVYDIVTVGLNTLNDIPFLLVHQTDNKIENFDYDGLIGFGYKCKSKASSNIDLYKKIVEKNINKKQLISYEVNLITQSGSFIYGSLPREFNDKSKLYRKFKINSSKTNGHWETILHSIYFDEIMYKLNVELSIGIGGNILSVDQYFFDFLIREKFDKYINEGSCSIENGEVREIYCKEDFKVNNFDYFGFVVGKWNFKIYPQNLFINVVKNKINKKWFAMIHHKKINKWYISQNIFGNSILIFDKEKDIIGYLPQ